MPTVLLLMPTNSYRAGAFLAAAHKLGLETVVGSEERQALESLTPITTVALDFSHPGLAETEIIELARRRQIDAIIATDERTAVLAASASRAIGLPHNHPDAALATRFKHRMRSFLDAAQVLTPDWKLIPGAEEPGVLAQTMSYPCVLKPTFLSGSRGVIKANSKQEFIDAFKRISRILRLPDVVALANDVDEPVMAEAYVPGREYVVEGIITRGELRVLTIFDKPDAMEGPYFEETIYVTPTRLPAARQSAIVASVSRAAKALGLQHGPVHAELRLNDEGIWLIEIAARSIGGLCSQALRFENDISLEELILRHAVGEEITQISREQNAAGVMMIPIPRAGVLRDVIGEPAAAKVPGVERIIVSIAKSQRVVPLPEGNRYLGFIFARAGEPVEVEEALRKAHARLAFVID